MAGRPLVRLKFDLSPTLKILDLTDQLNPLWMEGKDTLMSDEQLYDLITEHEDFWQVQYLLAAEGEDLSKGYRSFKIPVSLWWTLTLDNGAERDVCCEVSTSLNSNEL